MFNRDFEKSRELTEPRPKLASHNIGDYRTSYLGGHRHTIISIAFRIRPFILADTQRCVPGGVYIMLVELVDSKSGL